MNDDVKIDSISSQTHLFLRQMTRVTVHFMLDVKVIALLKIDVMMTI